jgi:hypothetical protein
VQRLHPGIAGLAGDMKKITEDSIPTHVAHWFGTQVQSIALRHDLTGPQINRVRNSKYRKQLVKEIRSRALAATVAREVAIAMKDLDGFCELAADELIRIRGIRNAHRTGKLTTEAMRLLPAYSAYPDYLNEVAPLGFDEILAAARDQWNLKREGFSPEPLSQPGHPIHPISPPTRAWMELQAFALACADDAWGPAFGSVPMDDYITDSAIRIRENARRAIHIGELHVHPEDVDKICWVAAGEAFLLRDLKTAKDAGKLTDEDIRKMPIYGPYKDYFEIGSDLVNMAASIAAAAGHPIRWPGAHN